MDREVIFRAKCSKESRFAGEWVEGGIVIPKEIKNNEVLIISAYSNDCMHTYHVDKDTVGQFTGMRDRNKKKIYDGDIVKDSCERLFLVEYCEHDAAFLFICNEPEFSDYMGLYDTEHYFEVIGNRFDNSDLIDKHWL